MVTNSIKLEDNISGDQISATGEISDQEMSSDNPVRTKEIIIEDERNTLSIFDDITDEEREYKTLKSSFSNIFNVSNNDIILELAPGYRSNAQLLHEKVLRFSMKRNLVISSVKIEEIVFFDDFDTEKLILFTYYIKNISSAKLILKKERELKNFILDDISLNYKHDLRNLFKLKLTRL